MIQAVVRKRFPGWRLPTRDDLKYDWAQHFDPESLHPLLCRGDFFGDGKDAIAFFVLKKDHFNVVIAREGWTVIELFHIAEAEALPQCMYLRPVEPGTHDVGESVWQNEDGPRQVTIPHSGVELGKFESASCLYFWSNAACFEHQWITD